jgi:hypothetical protein
MQSSSPVLVADCLGDIRVTVVSDTSYRWQMRAGTTFGYITRIGLDGQHYAQGLGYVGSTCLKRLLSSRPMAPDSKPSLPYYFR